MIQTYPVHPVAVAKTFVASRGLLWELTKRDFISRYKGSFFGIAWSLFNPLLMLAIYTFVFSVAFRARWGVENESQVDFAIVLFSGLIIHSLFAECLSRAPMLITGNPNYVKKVVFPLEILPLMALGSALGHFLVSLSVLLLFCLFTMTPIHLGGLLLPFILLPLLLMLMGLSWLLASLGLPAGFGACDRHDLQRCLVSGACLLSDQCAASALSEPSDAQPDYPADRPVPKPPSVGRTGEPVFLAREPWCRVARLFLWLRLVSKTRRGFADVL